jgi:hypothetical protein
MPQAFIISGDLTNHPLKRKAERIRQSIHNTINPHLKDSPTIITV